MPTTSPKKIITARMFDVIFLDYNLEHNWQESLKRMTLPVKALLSAT